MAALVAGGSRSHIAASLARSGGNETAPSTSWGPDWVPHSGRFEVSECGSGVAGVSLKCCSELDLVRSCDSESESLKPFPSRMSRVRISSPAYLKRRTGPRFAAPFSFSGRGPAAAEGERASPVTGAHSSPARRPARHDYTGTPFHRLYSTRGMLTGSLAISHPVNAPIRIAFATDLATRRGW